jgi:hypothetical protein
MQFRELSVVGTIAVIVIAAALASVATYALTTVIPGTTKQPAKYVYTATFACGSPSFGIVNGLAPASYFTVINVHNPSFQKTNVTLIEKFVLDEPLTDPHVYVHPNASQYWTASPPSPWLTPSSSLYALRVATLGPDAATRIDCNDIRAMVNHAVNASSVCCNENQFPYVIGYVEIITTKPISSPGLLDVWVDYTSLPSGTQPGSVNTTVTPSWQVVQIQQSQFVP